MERLQVLDLKGVTFGRLTAIEPAKKLTKGGKTAVIATRSLVSRATRSCGCLAEQQSAESIGQNTPSGVQ